jgi:hypothetical protein
MLRQALADLPIDSGRSILIGDSLRDIGAARGIGISAYGVRTGYACRDRERYQRESGAPPSPDLMFATVQEAVDFAIGYRALAEPVLGEIRRIRERGTKPILVAVSGRARAGKSVVAHAVLRCLKEQGVACLHVRLDDWIMPATERPQGAAAELRNRVDVLPQLLQALRAGESISAPGYDAATRGCGDSVRYEPAGQSVVLIDGGFAAHQSVRDMLDLAIFVAVPPALQRERFEAFYGWKKLDDAAIEALWRERSVDEWPAIDAQHAAADLVVEPDRGG